MRTVFVLILRRQTCISWRRGGYNGAAAHTFRVLELTMIIVLTAALPKCYQTNVRRPFPYTHFCLPSIDLFFLSVHYQSSSSQNGYMYSDRKRLMQDASNAGSKEIKRTELQAPWKTNRIGESWGVLEVSRMVKGVSEGESETAGCKEE